MKSLVCSLREQGRRVLILDFKNDYASDTAFVERAQLEPRFVAFEGLPYNPLIPTPIRHPRTGELVLQCSQHISGVASVVRQAFRLGDQQEASVKEAIRSAFADFGLAPTGTIEFDESQNFPDFNEVGARLLRDNERAYRRLDPLFDLGIFLPNHQQGRFDRVLEGSLVIDLSGIQSDGVKNTLAQILVLSAHAYYNAREHHGGSRQFLVFDEAHRILESPFLLRFVRECRAYGIGVILSSQYPSDFGAEVAGSLSTKIIHGNDRDEARVRDIARLLGYEGPEEDIASLEKFDALVSNKHHKSVRVQTLAYPLYLLATHLRDRGPSTVEDIGPIDGLDEGKLPLRFLVSRLQEMGVVEERNGSLVYVSDQTER